MKRILTILTLAILTSAATAQNTNTQASQAATASAPATEQVVSVPKTHWLVPFDKIKIDGPMNVTLKRVETADASKIVYDTKGNITSKFKFDVDRDGTLVVSEKADSKRTTVTDVAIYYNSLSDVKISHAKSVFESKIESSLFDLSVSGGAIVSLEIEAIDIAAECTGPSRLTLSGSTKYLTMRASSAKVNCSELSAVSATIEASHSSEVRLVVSERLEATTSTGAKLLYKGNPTIVREHTAIFGGDIININ